ncbi:MAG: rod shape-determining protein RodA [Candidatus Omnitrophica bacterium]|nr:rod shape-determining protein RodA [Candidatus Omnitrophota bacterium]
MKKNALMIIGCVLILNVLSILCLYSSLHQAGEFVHKDIFYKQIVWIAVSWIVVGIVGFINYRVYFDFSFIIYGISLGLLIAVKFFGREVMGAKRWFSFLGVNFQPSEFAKLAILILLARFFWLKREERNLFLKKVMAPLGLVFVSFLLIFTQPDLGTGLVCVLLFFIMGFSSRIPKKYFFVLLISGMILAPFGWNVLKDYQKKRLLVFLNPNIEPWGAGYTIIQSKIAIGSGRITGKGFLGGTQNQFNFLPERHTDFIFTVLAEEWGFLGGLFLVIVYYLILRNILMIARGAKDEFGYFLAIGVGSLYFLHIFVNMGMTMGILPVVGIPLLFLSYGGTHMMMTFVLLGIVFNITRQQS